MLLAKGSIIGNRTAKVPHGPGELGDPIAARMLVAAEPMP